MSSDLFNIIKTQMAYRINQTNLDIGKRVQGKVRDLYDLDDKLLIIATDRISAFDQVISTIPFKGAILNQLSLYWFEQTKDIIDNHIIEKIGENGVLVKKCKIIPIEVIIRGYLTGSGWRSYQASGEVSGIKLAQGLQKNCALERPILTPTTKAATGHDQPISLDEIVKQNIISQDLLKLIEEKALALFERGQNLVQKNNLILVDTKYEFGLLEDGTLILADEIHTSDSSRFWFLDSYQSLFQQGKEPQMLDKEFLRQYLMSQNYMGEGDIPQLPFEITLGIVERYLSAYEKITGSAFPLKNHDCLYALEQAVKQLNCRMNQ